MSTHEEKTFKAELLGQDLLQIHKNSAGQFKFEMVGCFELVELVTSFKAKYGKNIEKWPEPSGNSHSAILLRELLNRLHGRNELPYVHTELCHCRSVNVDQVKKAILNGAHSVELIAQITSAGTACGTCRPDTEKIIQHFLQSNSDQGKESET